ncbi:S1C family serine protease [Candidatus Thioglobus sp.]|nr:S1C family serine protease [Candidatus Thioglobus sp.]
MKKLITFVFIIFSISSGLASTQVVNAVFPSTLLIVVEDKNGQVQSLGSGFLVAPNVIATNYHVIENSYSGYVKLVNEDKLYDIDGVVGYNAQYDLALVKISDNIGNPLTFKSSSVDIGQKIFAIGNPLGLEGTISDGIISGLRDFEGVSLLQISAPISPGNSGGPVVDENGELVGVATSTFEQGQNLNFAVPVKYLKELINNQTALASLSSLVKTSKVNTSKSSNDYKGAAITKLLVSNSCVRTNTGGCDISFSLKNNLRQKIGYVRTVYIIYDSDGEVLDANNKTWLNNPVLCIPPKMATRLNQATGYYTAQYLFTKNLIKGSSQDLLKYVEFRILDFQICD